MVRDRIRIWRTGLHTPINNSQEYPTGSKITKQEGGIAASNVCLQSLQALPLSLFSPRDFFTLPQTRLPNLLTIRQKLLSYTKRRLARADMENAHVKQAFLFTVYFNILSYRLSSQRPVELPVVHSGSLTSANILPRL